MCLSTSPTKRNMDDLKKRLTRSISGPRRCTFCHKMVYFSVSKCKECGDVIHKHCVHHANHRTSTKDSEIAYQLPNTDPTLWCSRDHAESNKNRTMSDSSYDYEDTHQGMRHNSTSVAMSGLLKIVRWLSHRKKTKELNYKNNVAVEKHVKERFGLNPKLDDKDARKKLKVLLKTTHRSSQPQESQQQQRQQLFQKTRCSSARSAPTAASNRCQRRLCRSFAIRTGDSNVPSPRSSASSHNDVGSPYGTPKSSHDDPFTPVNGENDQIPLLRGHRRDEGHVQTSTNFPSASQKHPDVFNKQALLPECSGWTFSERHFLKSDFDARRKYAVEYDASQTTSLRFGKRPFGKAKTLSLESHNCSNDSLCATWPPVGKGGTIIEEGSEDDETDFEKGASDSLSSDCHRGEESLREWCIPFSDIEFEERIRNGRQGDIFKGRWYGEVLIYTVRESNSDDFRQFLEDVAQMGMIRHENIVLFMGACIEPPKLAVITSMRKGPTLYEYVHLKRNRLPFHSKLNIARQIAQGMGYLHAKGITHKRLNSKNIILESRVKLCMMDYGMADTKLDRANCGCISRGQLSYISPELLKSLRIEPPRIYPTAAHTQQSDVFAFGSLLFELLAERFAFQDQHPHAIIWKVATGKRSSLEHFRFITGLKSLIRRCWSQNPLNRPPFSEIVIVLQENVSHHKRHSSSVPDKLQYTGHSIRRNICT